MCYFQSFLFLRGNGYGHIGKSICLGKNEGTKYHLFNHSSDKKTEFKNFRERNSQP